MTDLDAVLKESLAKASLHTKKVYGRNPLTAREIIDLANTKGMMVLGSTVRLNGKPHLSPMDVIGLDGTVYLGVDEATAHYANLKRNSAIALIIVEGYTRQVILEGTVEFLDLKSGLAKRIQEAQKRKTGWTTEAVAELKPEKIFSWKGK